MNQEFDKDIEHEKLDLFAQNLKIDEIPVPEELENRIRARIPKVKRHPDLLLKIGYVAAALIFLFIGGVKASPAFAGYMSSVPLIGNAVQWLQGDSGIRKANENGYKNLGPIVLEKDGITLTLDNIYFDEDRLRMSAVAEGKSIEQKNFSKQAEASVEINPADGKPINGAIETQPVSSGIQPMIRISYTDFAEPGGTQESRGFNGEKLEILSEKTFKPGEVKDFLKSDYMSGIHLKVKVYKENEWSTDFGTVTIPFDEKDILMSRVYPQKEKIEIEHGAICIDKLTISPTRMRLDISFIMERGWFFTGFENIELWDGEGNVYKSEGLLSSNWDEKTRSLYMVPSLYFDKLPEKLYFSFNGIRIGTEEGRAFDVRPGEPFPRKISYMGYEITITNVEYKDGQLEISCRISANKLLNINGLELCGDSSGHRTIYAENSGSDGHTDWFKSIFKVEKKDSYKLKFEYPGYLYNKPETCKLELVESER